MKLFTVGALFVVGCNSAPAPCVAPSGPPGPPSPVYDAATARDAGPDAWLSLAPAERRRILRGTGE